MSNDKLLPCPFCGGEAELTIDDSCDSVTIVTIECSKCACEICESEFHTECSDPAVEKAAKAWNTRTQQHEAEIAELKDRLAKVLVYAQNVNDDDCWQIEETLTAIASFDTQD